MFSHLLIWHGRRRCYARGPDCPNCENKIVMSARRGGRSKNETDVRLPHLIQPQESPPERRDELCKP